MKDLKRFSNPVILPAFSGMSSQPYDGLLTLVEKGSGENLPLM
jgi:hypothetical protein